MFENKKVAIVYDRVNKWGGAERVLLALHKIFPNAPLYTSVYDEKNALWAKVFPKIYTSFLQKIPFAKNNHELFAVLMPIAFEQFNFDEYELVISVTSESAKGIITKPFTKHICYMLTPTRYLWSGYSDYFKNPLLKFLASPVINYLKTWDKIVAQRPDLIISISSEVRKRAKRYYDKKSEVIHPPVEIKNLNLNKNFKLKIKNYFLYVGRFVGYKKIDLVINTFNKLKLPLVVVGTGRLAHSLKHKAESNIKFVGHVSEEDLSNYYSNAKALIMPQLEDFGIVAVEAQLHGVPVIAFSQGGACDTVIDGVTGLLFDEQNVGELTKAIEKFEKIRFNKRVIINNAKKFSFEVFKEKFIKSITKL